MVWSGWAAALLDAWVEEVDAMLPGRAANALHDPGNHVDLEPSEHAGCRNLRRKGQKRDARWRCQTAPGRPERGSKLEQKLLPFSIQIYYPSIPLTESMT